MSEQVQDNIYELKLDFEKGTFEHRYRKVVYEGGDGFYETRHQGSFSIESSGAAKKPLSRKGSKKANLSAPSLSPTLPPSPRKPDPDKYYVAKCEVRGYTSCWEPWDRRQAPESVRREGDTYHQELLFRYVSAEEIVNENTSPACHMHLVQ